VLELFKIIFFEPTCIWHAAGVKKNLIAQTVADFTFCEIRISLLEIYFNCYVLSVSGSLMIHVFHVMLQIGYPDVQYTRPGHRSSGAGMNFERHFPIENEDVRLSTRGRFMSDGGNNGVS
jgi:hypothetical protein